MATIRPYTKTDRKLVRQICCDVADLGGPVEEAFFDRELIADMLTNYYTDYEPRSTFVAEADGKVVGYIQGCLDNRRYGLVFLFLILPKLIIKGFIRGVFFRSELWRFFIVMLKNSPRVYSWRKSSFHSHQGHLHIGLVASVRGHQIGKRLVETFWDHIKGHEIHEITASVHHKNADACRFFEKMGFIEGGRYPMVMGYGKTLKKYYSIQYVKKII
jgi:ribosomal protein S18 acetylase RimI-like enzyme